MIFLIGYIWLFIRVIELYFNYVQISICFLDITTLWKNREFLTLICVQNPKQNDSVEISQDG